MLLLGSAVLAGATSALEGDPLNQVLQPPEAQQSGHPPNVVLILADDLGFSDIAPYGSEINTPICQRLASGVSFTNYHTAATVRLPGHAADGGRCPLGRRAQHS